MAIFLYMCVLHFIRCCAHICLCLYERSCCKPCGGSSETSDTALGFVDTSIYFWSSTESLMPANPRTEMSGQGGNASLAFSLYQLSTASTASTK